MLHLTLLALSIPDTTKNKMKDKTLNRLLFLVGFLTLVFYYGLIHPLVPFDTDDWMNLSLSRPLYPSLKCWNPTKVFPECLETTAATIAARYITPIIGDYINSLILVNAIVLSFFITIYLYLAQKLLIERFHLSLLSSFCIIVFFALLHFLALKTKPFDNDYLWYAEDCNCYYHYIISNLLNACLILWLLRCNTNDLWKRWHVAILAIVTYFALCSNLYSTIILISYAGAMLLYNLYACNKSERIWLKIYIQQNVYFLIVVGSWFIIQLIEMNGIRAKSYGHIDDSLVEYVPLAIQNLLAVRFNLGVILFMILMLLGAKIHNHFSSNHKILHIGKQQTVILLAAILSLLYLIILSAKVKPENMQKGQIIFSWFFFFLLLSILCTGYIISRIKAFRYLLPLCIFLVSFNFQNIRREFLGVQCLWGTTEYECIEYGRDFINHVLYTEALGQDSVIIQVPKFDYKDNWPLSFDCGFAIGNTLYKHGITRRHLKSSFKL